jgi:hypothetical protein
MSVSDRRNWQFEDSKLKLKKMNTNGSYHISCKIYSVEEASLSLLPPRFIYFVIANAFDTIAVSGFIRNLALTYVSVVSQYDILPWNYSIQI